MTACHPYPQRYGNEHGLDMARAAASNAKWQAAEDARDRAIEAESEQCDRELTYCRDCQYVRETTEHDVACPYHANRWNIPQ